MDLQLDRTNAVLAAFVALVVLTGAFFALAPKAFAEKSDCPAGDVCVWEGPTFGGNRAFFAGSETGCHSLANIDPKSAYNHTGNHAAILVNLAGLAPGEAISDITPAFTGELCIN
jgi:hypothetical protein